MSRNPKLLNTCRALKESLKGTLTERLKGTRKDSYILAGSWLVISVVISRVTVLTTHIRGLIPALTSTLNPKS